jgi:hypothetical protein
MTFPRRLNFSFEKEPRFGPREDDFFCITGPSKSEAITEAEGGLFHHASIPHLVWGIAILQRNRSN